MRRSACAFASLLALAGCLGGATDRPVGSSCSGDDECAAGLVCQYGRCRAECAFDRDCPEGSSCLPAEDGGGGVCTVEGEGGASGECPAGSAIGPDGLCHEACESVGEPCDGPRECTENPDGSPVCTLISLRVELACLGEPIVGTDGLSCETNSDGELDEATLDGLDDGLTFTMTARFRGAVETNSYEGGEQPEEGSPFWYVENDPENPVDPGSHWNTYELWVTSPVGRYFANAGVSGLYVIHPVDITVSFEVAGGATLTLLADPADGLMVRNPSQPEGDLVTVDGVPPPTGNGQFMQMDVLAVEPLD